MNFTRFKQFNRLAAGSFYAFLGGIILLSLLGRVLAQENTASPVFNSIIFTKEEIQWVKEALKAHEQNIPIEILLPNIFPTEQTAEEPVKDVITSEEGVTGPPIGEQVTGTVREQQDPVEKFPATAPAFYLKSILYFDDNNWTIWLNDMKISNGNKYDNLDIIDVTSNQVVFLWKQTELDKIFPDWQKTFYMLDKGKHASNNKNIVIDLDNKNVSFILQPNQTLVTRNMTIIEGMGKAVPIVSPADIADEMQVDLFNEDYTRVSQEDATKHRKQTNADNSKDFLMGHNPADGLESMQKYMKQLNMLKSMMDAQSPAQQ